MIMLMNNEEEDHENDGVPHILMSVTTYTPDGCIGVSVECCSCKMQDSEAIEHVRTMPKGMYMAFLPIPLQRH